MTPELVERGGRLIVSTGLLNIAWVGWANTHAGKWDAGSKAWVFRPDQRAAVEEALREIFGEGEE